jgi:cobalamin biosynthesis protein CbiG
MNPQPSSTGSDPVEARPSRGSDPLEGGRGLVVGAGCSLGCPAEELGALVAGALADVAGIVVAVATVDRRAEEPCVVALAVALGVPLRTYPAAALAAVAVPTPSAAVVRHVGTPSVAEAAARLAARGEIVVPKRRSPHATCAIAEEPQWPE